MSFDFLTYLIVAAGIIISVLLPILRHALPKPKAGTAGVSALLPRLWAAAKPCLATFGLSLITAPLVMAIFGNALNTWPAALLAGFGWEAAIEKVKAS